MSDNEVKEIFWQSYNVFWNKWKTVPLQRDSEAWDQVVKDATEIMSRYNNPMCKQVVMALLTELEDRCRALEKGA